MRHIAFSLPTGIGAKIGGYAGDIGHIVREFSKYFKVIVNPNAVNGGILYKPYIVKNIAESETGEIIEAYEPNLVREVISEDTSRSVRMALESVVALGTGRNRDGKKLFSYATSAKRQPGSTVPKYFDSLGNQ